MLRCALIRSPASVRIGFSNTIHHNNNPESTISSSLFRATTRRSVFDKRVQIPKGGGDGVAANTVPLQPVRQTAFTRLVWYAKVVRVPFLITAIYGLGYRQGIMDAARNPLKLQQGTFEAICMEMGVQSGDDVEIISERPPQPAKLKRLGWMYGETAMEKATHSERAHKVADIGREIIRAARAYTRQELYDAMNKAKKKINAADLSEKELMKALNEDEQVEYWLNAVERIEGFTPDGIQNWQYILVKTPIQNVSKP